MDCLARGIRVSLVAAMVVLSACQRSVPVTLPDAADVAAWADIGALAITDVIAGSGTEASAGKTVEVHYEGWLYDVEAADHQGVRFDSSRERGRPFSFRIGAGNVIAGWEQGVVGMRVGGRRQLVIPARLGYGDRGAGGGVIPPGAALVFDIELLRVE